MMAMMKILMKMITMIVTMTMMMSVTSLLWLGPPVVLVLVVIVVVDVVVVIELLKHAQYSVLDQLKLSHTKKTLTWSCFFVCLLFLKLNIFQALFVCLHVICVHYLKTKTQDLPPFQSGFCIVSVQETGPILQSSANSTHRWCTSGKVPV